MTNRILFTALGSLLFLAGRADDKSKALVDRLAQKIASCTSYEVTFSASMPEQFDDVQGRIVVSGDRYYVDVNGSELFCDGKLLYTYRADDNEATVEEPDPDDPSLLSNPPRFFRLESRDFGSAYKGPATAGGRKVERVELIPKNRGAGFRSILLDIASDTGLPVSVVYRMEGDDEIEIEILTFKANVPVSKATFSFDKSKYKGVEIIDFR